MKCPEIFEVWWFNGTESHPKPEYRSAGPSPYGQHHKLTACKVWRGEHVCYIKAASLRNAMRDASERHPDWAPLPVSITVVQP